MTSLLWQAIPGSRAWAATIIASIRPASTSSIMALKYPCFDSVRPHEHDDELAACQGIIRAKHTVSRAVNRCPTRRRRHLIVAYRVDGKMLYGERNHSGFRVISAADQRQVSHVVNVIDYDGVGVFIVGYFIVYGDCCRKDMSRLGRDYLKAG